MSVESAMDGVYDAFERTLEANFNKKYGDWPGFDNLLNTKLPELAMNRLILEVRAEFDCQSCMQNPCVGGRCCGVSWPLCRSCAAR